MPDPASTQITRMRPVDWFAIALLICDTIEAPRTNTRTDLETVHHASSCYRRAEHYVQIMNQQQDLDRRPHQ